MQNSAKKATFTAQKSLTFYTFSALNFSAWQGCTAFLANLKVYTNTKKRLTFAALETSRHFIQRFDATNFDERNEKQTI